MLLILNLLISLFSVKKAKNIILKKVFFFKKFNYVKIVSDTSFKFDLRDIFINLNMFIFTIKCMICFYTLKLKWSKLAEAKLFYRHIILYNDKNI